MKAIFSSTTSFKSIKNHLNKQNIYNIHLWFWRRDHRDYPSLSSHTARQTQPLLKLYTKGEIVFYLKWRRKKSKLCHLVLLPTMAGPQPDRSPVDTWFVENLASIQLTSDTVTANYGNIALENLKRRNKKMQPKKIFNVVLI